MQKTDLLEEVCFLILLARGPGNLAVRTPDRGYILIASEVEPGSDSDGAFSAFCV